MAVKYWMKKKYVIINNNYSVSTLIDMGLITSIICPSVIGVFDSGFLFATSLTTTTIHALALGGLCFFGMYQPEWIFNSNATGIQVPDVSLNGTDVDHIQIQGENHYDSMSWYLICYTLILVQTLYLLSNSIAFGIGNVFMSMNEFYNVVIAIETSNIQLFQDNPTMKKKLQ